MMIKHITHLSGSFVILNIEQKSLIEEKEDFISEIVFDKVKSLSGVEAYSKKSQAGLMAEATESNKI